MAETDGFKSTADTSPAHCTTRDIAQRAGVSVSTVARALKDDPRISEKRRLQIQEFAREMGYRPNPMVSTLMAGFRKGRHRADTGCSLAVVYRSRSLGDGPPVLASLMKGAAALAGDLGYGFESHDLLAEPLPAAQLEKRLWQRGVKGILLSRRAVEWSDFAEHPWSKLALAGCGPNLTGRPLPHAMANYHQHISLAFRELRKRSLHRVGLVLSRDLDRLSGERWLAQYLHERFLANRDGHDLPKPVFYEDFPGNRREAVADWALENRLDALLLHDEQLLVNLNERAEQLPPHFFPVGLGGLLPATGFHRGAWIDQRPERIGRAAIEVLVQQIHHNRRGWSEDPLEVAIEGQWRPACLHSL